MNTTKDLMNSADRALELLEQKSPHQLAVELAELQHKHDIALAALNKMQDQRDQLAAQLKDATAQCGVMADLLRAARPSVSYQMGMQRSDTGHRETFADLLNHIDTLLAGQVPEPAVLKGGE